MQYVLVFLQKYEIWIYIVLGVVALIYARKVVIAFKDWRSAIFGLEREHAQRHFGAVSSMFVLLVLVMAAEFITVSFIVPSYPGLSTMLTPTIDLLTMPTQTIEPGMLTTVEPLNLIGQQPTIAAEGCIPGQVEWTFPTANAEISGTVELRGTVNIINLGFYKFEFSQPGSTTWVAIAAGDQVKVDEPLGGMWNTSQLIPGDYLLRLVVTDSQNNLLPACVIPVRVVSP